LPGCEQKTGRVTTRIDGGVDFGAQPAFAASERLVFTLFFFAPALC
jgi:hypothetical protein